MNKTNKNNPKSKLKDLQTIITEPLESDVKSIGQQYARHLKLSMAKDEYSATKNDKFKSLVYTVRDRLFEKWINTQQSYYHNDVKRVYYLSMEYMMGRMLGNAMINLGLENTFHQALQELGIRMEELQNLEFDAGLGNGGLGRLAACFLDSMATLQLPAYGYGIRYEYGIFTQKFKDGWQIETPDHWLRYGNPWEIERPEYIYKINFYGDVQTIRIGGEMKHEWIDTEEIIAIAYDTPVPGYHNDTVNNFRLWSAKSTREFNLEFFNSGDYEKAVEDKISSEVISKVLYPRDDFVEGRELRLKQEYFLVSATLQDIIRRFKKIYHNEFRLLPEKVAIQLNDTHPTLAIPELMRILIDLEGLNWDEAWEISQKTFGYTNHTVLPEALETWRIALLEKMLPRHMQIIYDINARFLKQITEKFPNDTAKLRRMSIIEESQEKRIRMANLAIIGSHSVNGVAKLHTNILKTDLFRDFYEIYPERFNNKTNGITQRRWLRLANPLLSNLITETIGDKWITELTELKKLENFADDTKFQEQWQEIKYKNKKHLSQCIHKHLGIELNPESMFASQIKRIHEYKRQLLNALYIITLFNRLKSDQEFDMPARTVIFAGKAAPAYTMAKLIIKLINSIAKKINNDPEVNDRLSVIFMPNYSVSQAQMIIPATDLSEQISTAGMEASGTGNMKLSLNGALTIGTLDGANVEIIEQVGKENIFIFGLKADEVHSFRAIGYNPQQYYEQNTELKAAIDMIADGYFSEGQRDLYKPLLDSLLHNDYFMVLADYQSYVDTQSKVNELYLNKREWIKKSIINSANMGKFSSDRTIQQYAEDIWKVKPLKI
ncbi:MAG: glycogen/starch/alpha-glucan phosphorylase [Calditrichaceae bacterium]|nr:glycogen/starch/alpha-glucan phosphorylase [Calditrichaceae bacterium]